MTTTDVRAQYCHCRPQLKKLVAAFLAVVLESVSESDLELDTLRWSAHRSPNHRSKKE